jgi:hypothetical protein
MTTTQSSSSTTTSTTVKPGLHKPIDLFAHVACQGGLAFSSLTFGQRQRVVCIKKETVLTLYLGIPPAGDHWEVSGMKKSTNGDVVAIHSQGTYGGYTFVYRGVRPGIDFVHVFMLMPCPKTGCNASGGPPILEAQWVIRVVPAPSPYPATLTMQHGLTFSSVTRALRWGTTLGAAQARQVTITSIGSTYRWGVRVTDGGPTFPVHSTDGGATWTAAGPQLATDWAGGSLYYVSKVIPEGPSAVVMVSNSIIDVTTDGGHQWNQYLNADDDWTMAGYAIGGGGIGLRVSPTSNATWLPRSSYAVYSLDVARHEWHRIWQTLP